ncbi:hypothetical protein POL68_32370 [Stigmatella sp. ncwal1]|uniref:Threonine dehydratase n=1 Tax=Stigmatella ashevillensis TaxID=2995309 RepID=A0ABT5DHR5_9BACT|nr:hypothetical protein [Stigmatella ashevillena]MDC0713202.1 hypothetical protein [Stigmatella ashevillena]
MSKGSRHHDAHEHQHAGGCGHTAIHHGDHVDYLHEGHLHRKAGPQYQECRIEAGAMNLDQCTPHHQCSDHVKDHLHGPSCGHEAVPHGEHVDYLVGGHLHHPHGSHCDDHGSVRVVK